MTPAAKIQPEPRGPAEARDPFASFWNAPVPALKPLGVARVIHSWEAPQDLWQKPDRPASAGIGSGGDAGKAATPLYRNRPAGA